MQGRFHAFDLAKQLQRASGLTQLMTTYPKYAVEKFGLPRNLVTSCPWQEAFKRGWWKLPQGIRSKWNSQYFLSSSFDRFAARHLKEGANIFVGWSASSLRTMRRAKQLGMITVLERGSSHMLFQQQIMTEEFARAGLTFNETHPAVIEQELAEYEEADYISIPSTYVKRTFLDYGVSESKLIQNPYGVNLNQFEPVPKADDVFRVIQCGMVSLRKGIPYLLQAFAELDLPRAELWLVGRVTDEIQPILSKFSRPSIVVHGPKPQAELKWYYSQCNACCLMSLEEGLAMVQAQAMACGLPLICTTNTGGEDLVEDGSEGFVIPIRDVEALKQKLLWCYQNRDACRQMGEAARQKVQQGFSWDDYGDRMLTAYQEVLAGSRQPRSQNQPL